MTRGLLVVFIITGIVVAVAVSPLAVVLLGILYGALETIF